MSRLDDLGEILGGYKGRKAPEELIKRFLLVIDRQYKDEDAEIQTKITSVSIELLLHSADYAAEYAVLTYRGQHAYFSGWHTFSHSGKLLRAVKKYQDKRPDDDNFPHGWLDDCAREAVQEENIRILYLMQGRVPQDFSEGIKEWRKENDNKVIILSPSVAAKFSNHTLEAIELLFKRN